MIIPINMFYILLYLKYNNKYNLSKSYIISVLSLYLKIMYKKHLQHEEFLYSQNS